MMGRPKAKPYTLGTIKVIDHPTMPGKKQANGYYRDRNNVRREATASGSSKAAAENALKSKVAKAEKAHTGGSGVLTERTTVAVAAGIWLDEKRREKVRGKPLSPNTLRDYEGYVLRSITGGKVEATGKVWPASPLAHLPVTEANDIARIEAWLKVIADERGEQAARGTKKALSGILGMCERAGAIPFSVMDRVRAQHAMPGTTGDRKCTKGDECDYECGKRHLDTKRAFTPAEALRVQTVADSAIYSKSDLGDLCAFLFGTGVRISEALGRKDTRDDKGVQTGVLWTDMDWDAGKVHIRGTKTKQADRWLYLHDDLIERLRNRADLHGTEGLMFGVTYFASKAGGVRERNNVTKAMRRVFKAADVRWAGTHTFRRTVASWMDDANKPLRTIANQLGHADTNVTAGYLGRESNDTGAADVMVLPVMKPQLQAV